MSKGKCLIVFAQGKRFDFRLTEGDGAVVRTFSAVADVLSVRMGNEPVGVFTAPYAAEVRSD